MPNTVMQTTTYSDGTVKQTLRPVLGMRQLVTPSGNMYFKLYDRIISITTDNILVTWHNKPTFNDAINNECKGCYYEFHNDGSVTYSYLNATNERVILSWSAETHTDETIGTKLDGNFDTYTNTYFEPIPCSICGSECYGSDYQDWQFCGRSCMVDFVNY